MPTRIDHETVPSAPSSSKSWVYVDSSDRRLKQIDDYANVTVLSHRVSKQNVLINGGFDFAQRQAPGTLTTYSNTSGRSYGPDRWGITNENASVQYKRVDTAAAAETGITSRYYGKFVKITNTGKMVISQVVEGVNTDTLRGRTVRLSCRMKYSVASSMTVYLGLAQNNSSATTDSVTATFISAFGAAGTDPTLGTNLAYIAPTLADGGEVGTNGVKCVLTSGWVRYSGVFTVPSNCVNLVAMIWTNGQPAALDELNVAEVALHDGAEIMDYSIVDPAHELVRAERFYCKTFDVGTAPAQNAGAGTGEVRFMAGKAGAATHMHWYAFRQRMRIAPATITLYNPAAANAQIRNITGSTDHTASAASVASESGVYITGTGNAGDAVGDTCAIHLTMDAEI
jgi:hypothetical protein